MLSVLAACSLVAASLAGWAPVAGREMPAASLAVRTEPVEICRATGGGDDQSGQLCTHADSAADVELGRPIDSYPQYVSDPDDGSLAPAATPGIECYGDGVTGKRVQAVYAYAEVDRSETVIAQIRNQFVATIDRQFNDSAKETEGERHVRWVHDANCDVAVTVIRLADDVLNRNDFFRMTTELRSLGLNRTDRIYHVWGDSSVFCGIGGKWQDDRPTTTNRSTSGPNYSRSDLPCWGRVEGHELMHNFGGVQDSAPNSTKAGHCRDEWDRMCYADSAGVTMDYSNAEDGKPCRGSVNSGHELLFDCNHDDYFNTNAAPDSYLSKFWNAADSPFLADGPGIGPEATGTFHSLAAPLRLMDSRMEPTGRLAPGRPYLVRATGPQPLMRSTLLGAPLHGVAAVVINVTVTDPRGAGFLSVRPYTAGSAFTTPTVSNLNFVAGQTVANLVTVQVGPEGLIQLFANEGTPYVIADVIGWYADGGGFHPAGGGYHPLTPDRILDTRTKANGIGTLAPGQAVSLKVAGAGGVPPTRAKAVILNVTAVDATQPSYLTLWAKDQPRPNTSNLNFGAGQATPNLVAARLAADGSINIFNEVGDVNVIIDVAGWFDDGTTTGKGAVFKPISPERVADTRATTALPGDTARSFPINGLAGVPPNAVAVVANITAVGPSGGGYLSVWPTGKPRPDVSNLNFVPGQTVPNLAFLTLNNGGADVYNATGTTHVLIDVAGWFGPPAAPTKPAPAPGL